MSTPKTDARGRWHLSLSVPREHGTWFMVYGPLLIGLTLGAPTTIDTVLLVMATTGAFFAQDAGRPVLRRRRDASWSWFAITLALAAGPGLLLLVRQPSIAYVAALGAVLAVPLMAMLSRRGRRRFDRSQWGQLVAMPLLTLTALAGYVVGQGTLEPRGWWLWGMCAVYFGSGVFVVHLLFEAAKKKQALDATTRWQLGRSLLGYHAAVTVAVAAGAVALGGAPGAWLAAGFAPVVLRALVVWARVTHTLPNLIKVGLLEAAYTTWFIVCTIIALRGW